MGRELIEATDIRFYLSSDETWEAMLTDCISAKESIDFEQYIIMDDFVGRKFLEVFLQKAREGLEVRLILDKIGSLGLLFSPLLDEFKKNGGKVLFYNPVKWWNIFMPSTWLPRNHSKTMVIDSRIAYIGGVCIAGYMAGWRDTHARIHGPLVGDIQYDFNCVWGRIAKSLKPKTCYYPHTSSGMSYVVNLPRFPASPIYDELLIEMRKAKSTILLASPYFFPPIRLRKELRNAVRRGVSVKVMVSYYTDVPFADHVSHSYFPPLLKAGIRILVYDKTVMHAKYAIIDDSWATMGSTNLDYLSLLRNREANIVIRDPLIIAELKGHFINDTKKCIEIDTEFWTRKPLLYKIIAYIGLSIKKIL